MTLQRKARLPRRRDDQPFYMAIDHCFAIRGQGTVLTGTVLSGRTFELPELRTTKKVKSIQMFRRPVAAARQGDRVGIAVAGLDPSLIERGAAAAPGTVALASAAVALVRKVGFFAGRVRSGALLHVTLGHSTVIAAATFFGAAEIARAKAAAATTGSRASSGPGKLGLPLNALPPWQGEFAAQAELAGMPVGGCDGDGDDGNGDGNRSARGDGGDGDGGGGGDNGWATPLQYTLLQFHSPVLAPPDGLVVGSRLDAMAAEEAAAAAVAAAAAAPQEEWQRRWRSAASRSTGIWSTVSATTRCSGCGCTPTSSERGRSTASPSPLRSAGAAPPLSPFGRCTGEASSARRPRCSASWGSSLRRRRAIWGRSRVPSGRGASSRPSFRAERGSLLVTGCCCTSASSRGTSRGR
ncbi:unnamed protein product [Phaeothamnion confervicola]